MDKTDPKVRVAMHEAAHAVVARAMRLRVGTVSVVTNNRANRGGFARILESKGRSHYRSDEAVRRYEYRQVIAVLAGIAMEVGLNGPDAQEKTLVAIGSDCRMARRMAREMRYDDEALAERDLAGLQMIASELVCWTLEGAIQDLAKALVASPRHRLTSREVRRVLDESETFREWRRNAKLRRAFQRRIHRIAKDGDTHIDVYALDDDTHLNIYALPSSQA